MCGLSLAWVTSEISTMLLESDILRLFLTHCRWTLSHAASPLCSGVWCLTVPVRGSTPTSAVRLSPVRPQLPSAPVQPPTLLSPVQLPTPLLVSSHQLLSALLGRVVNSHSPPRTTSGYGEISGPRILCLVSRQNRLVCFGGPPT